MSGKYLVPSLFVVAFIGLALGSIQFLPAAKDSRPVEVPETNNTGTTTPPIVQNTPTTSTATAATTSLNTPTTPPAPAKPPAKSAPNNVPSINIVTPNGGEHIPSGPDRYVVTYRMENFSQLTNPYLIMYLLRNDQVLGRRSFSQFHTDTSFWNFSWDVGSYGDATGYRKADPGPGYKVRLTMYDQDKEVASDQSDAAFTILPPAPVVHPSLKVISPNGGERWKQGDTYEVSWRSSNGSSLSIELLKGGQFVTSIVGTSGSSSLPFIWSWKVPENLANGSDYTVRVLESNYSSNYDISDAPFTIGR